MILEEEIPKRFVHGKGTFIWVGYQNRACLFYLFGYLSWYTYWYPLYYWLGMSRQADEKLMFIVLVCVCVGLLCAVFWNWDIPGSDCLLVIIPYWSWYQYSMVLRK